MGGVKEGIHDKGIIRSIKSIRWTANYVYILFNFKLLHQGCHILIAFSQYYCKIFYHPCGSKEHIFFNCVTFGTGHFFVFLCYISLSGLKQSLVLIYVLYIKRVNYSLTVVVSKIPFNKWQSIELTKETEVINKENCFSGNPNIWAAQLWIEISNLNGYDKTNLLLWHHGQYIRWT